EDGEREDPPRRAARAGAAQGGSGRGRRTRVTRRGLGLALALALVGCQGYCPPRARPLGRPPRLGHRVLVLAPHPDDEVLGASGLLAGSPRRASPRPAVRWDASDSGRAMSPSSATRTTASPPRGASAGRASLATAWMTARCAWQQGRLSARARLLVLFGVVGIVPVLGFPSSARYHAYWQFYLLPYATLSLAYVLERLAPRLSPGSRALVYAAVACWLAAASAFTLSTRYAVPSVFVVRKVPPS